MLFFFHVGFLGGDVTRECPCRPSRHGLQPVVHRLPATEESVLTLQLHEQRHLGVVWQGGRQLLGGGCWLWASPHFERRRRVDEARHGDTRGSLGRQHTHEGCLGSNDHGCVVGLFLRRSICMWPPPPPSHQNDSKNTHGHYTLSTRSTLWAWWAWWEIGMIIMILIWMLNVISSPNF